MAYPVAEMMQKLLEAGYSSTEAANMVAADAQRQAEERQAVSTTTTLRNTYGGF